MKQNKKSTDLQSWINSRQGKVVKQTKEEKKRMDQILLEEANTPLPDDGLDEIMLNNRKPQYDKDLM